MKKSKGNQIEYDSISELCSDVVENISEDKILAVYKASMIALLVTILSFLCPDFTLKILIYVIILVVIVRNTQNAGKRFGGAYSFKLKTGNWVSFKILVVYLIYQISNLLAVSIVTQYSVYQLRNLNDHDIKIGNQRVFTQAVTALKVYGFIPTIIMGSSGAIIPTSSNPGQINYLVERIRDNVFSEKVALDNISSASVDILSKLEETVVTKGESFAYFYIKQASKMSLSDVIDSLKFILFKIPLITGCLLLICYYSRNTIIKLIDEYIVRK